VMATAQASGSHRLQDYLGLLDGAFAHLDEGLPL